MNVQFVISVDLDANEIEREGRRHGLPLDRALLAVVSDLENRLHDSVRFRDGVSKVGSDVKLPAYIEGSADLHAAAATGGSVQ